MILAGVDAPMLPHGTPKDHVREVERVPAWNAKPANQPIFISPAGVDVGSSETRILFTA